MVFFKTRPFVKRNNAEFTNISSFTSLLMCSTQFTWSCRILPFSLPTTNNLFKFVYFEITGSLPGRSCLGPLGVVCFSGNWRSSELDSLRFWTSDIQDLPTSCRKFVYFTFCLYFVSCAQKMLLSEHSLADTVPFFLTILQFSSELSKNWGTGLPSPCPLWIYCTGQQHSFIQYSVWRQVQSLLQNNSSM